jgi:tRNA nucleotidyltransferase (CCA-adding enzyme)
MRRVARQPFRIYRVGGSVRDELIGRAGGDRDWVVVGATPELMTASGFKPVGNDFPVFLHPETREEYALARTERKHGRGYRGFEFFASPEVTLEDDLARRDLTINAMAIDERGRLIDPHGGQADLRARTLRHVAPAFVEDPLRVLRVARFAARLGFAVAPETRRLMRKVVASGELSTLAPERVWQELARGLMEDHPSRMLAVLRECGALAELLPEVDALFAAVPAAPRRGLRPGAHLSRALDWAARRQLALPARAAVLMYDFAAANADTVKRSGSDPNWRVRVRRVDAICARLKAPVECRDAARLLARWHRTVERADRLTPAATLDLLQAADALRRPERLDLICAASAAVSCSRGDDVTDYAPMAVLRDALRVVSKVDAGAAARAATHRHARRDGATIAAAVRAARLAALRASHQTR